MPFQTHGPEAEEPDRWVPGSFGCHEALHMANFFANAVDEQLAHHPSITRHPAWSALADKAVAALADLYQAIALEHLAVTDKTADAIDEIMGSQGLSADRAVRAALAHYQQHIRRIQAGETFAYSGDEARAAEFAGPLAGKTRGGSVGK
jgi:hypothetical protein